jgi:hypothetical protein
LAARRFHGTYLPHVAPEQGWNVRQTIDSLIRKAGFDGPIDDALARLHSRHALSGGQMRAVARRVSSTTKATNEE